MRIAFVVDVHDRFEAVPRAMAEIGHADLLVVGGDVTTGGGPDDAARAVEQWRPLADSLLVVAGNMDSPAIDERLAELGVALDGRGVAFGDVGVFGVSGSPPAPVPTPYELTDEELERRIARGVAGVEGCRVKIFCPHAPPLDTACDQLPTGQHVGSAVVRAFVDRAHPDVVLCGHIHEARAVDHVGSTTVANPGPVSQDHYAVVDVDGGVTVRLDP